VQGTLWRGPSSPKSDADAGIDDGNAKEVTAGGEDGTLAVQFTFAYTLWLCQNSYWTWPFIVDFPIKMVIFHGYVSLPEGNTNKIELSMGYGIIVDINGMLEQCGWYIG